MMARVRGSLRVKMEPRPTMLFTLTRPLRRRTLERTTSMPDAPAGDVGDLLGGGEAGQEDHVHGLVVGHGVGAVLGDQAPLQGLLLG